MPEYPKFNARIMERVVAPVMQQAARPGYGVVMSFDVFTNTCTVVSALPGSDELGEIYTNVPMPVQTGVQAAAPAPGAMCWIMFRDGTQTDPYISHFFSWNYPQFNYQQQYAAKAPVPTYLLSM
jgi:hypothetical protein